MKDRSSLILVAGIICLVCITCGMITIGRTNISRIDALLLCGLTVITTTCILLIIFPSLERRAYNLGYAKAKREDVIETYMTLPLISREDNERYVSLFDSFYYQDQVGKDGNFWGVLSCYNDKKEEGRPFKITKRIKLSRDLDKNYETQEFQILS